MGEQNGMLVHRTEGTGDHAHECALAQEVHLVRELGVRVVMHASGSVCYSSQRLKVFVTSPSSMPSGYR